MSLFRRPKKPIQRRVFSCDGDEDEDCNEVPMEVDAAQPTNRHKDKKSDRKQREHADKPKTTSLLSFDDEGNLL